MGRYNVIVIGSGPGGYVAAIRAAQLGLNTAIVERERLGGVCLNWGCIPTKALLKSAHLLNEIRDASRFGIDVSGAEPDFEAIVRRSRDVADRMAKGVDFLMKKNKVTVINGTARFRDRHNIEVENGATKEVHQADTFIIATGARPRPLPGIEIDGKAIIGYREAMTLEKLPAKLCIIGAGAIGIEFADFYNAMGTKVTVIEALPRILPVEDEETSALVTKKLKRKGIEIHTGSTLESVDKPNGGKGELTVKFSDSSGNKKSVPCDHVFLAVGIAANTEELNLELVGVKREKDRIPVDSHYRTGVKNIYAIGDCIPGPALAHVASAEGIKAAEAIHLNLSPGSFRYEPLNYDLIPGCTYCEPEVASVGLTEAKAKERGIKFRVGRFPFTASGRATASGETDGFVKLIVDEAYGQIIGAHIVGPMATELIGEVALGASLEAVAESFARTVHAHPTLSEAIMEAAADALGEAINI